MALTYINYIPTGDGNYIDFNKLSKEEQEKVSDKITTRLMESMGYRKAARKGIEDESKAEIT